MQHEPPSVPELITAIESSTASLAESVGSLRPEQINDDCALPRWTRGHLLTHLARNADGLRNLLLAARSGEPLRMYASSAARDEDIRVGATRQPEVIVADFSLSHDGLASEIRHLPASDWNRRVTLHTVAGPAEQPASAILEMRLREVEIHHVDLAIGHDYSTTEASTLHLLLVQATGRHAKGTTRGLDFTATDTGRRYIVDEQSAAQAGPDVASASAAELLGYLTGRADPSPLLSHLPDPPKWG